MSNSRLVPSNALLDRYRSSLGRERAAWPFEQRNAGVQLAWRERELEDSLASVTDASSGKYVAVGATSFGGSDEVRVLLRNRESTEDVELVWNEARQEGRIEGTLNGLSAVEHQAVTTACQVVANRWLEADAHLRNDSAADVIIARADDRADTFATRLRDRGVNVAVVDVSVPEHQWLLDRVDVGKPGQRLVVIADDRASALSHPMWRGSHPSLEREALEQLAPREQETGVELVIASTPDCGRCQQWSNLLTRRGVPHQLVDVTRPENSELARTVKKLGYTQAPVTFVPPAMRGAGVPAHFGEMRPDLLSSFQTAVPVDAFERDGAHFPQEVNAPELAASAGVTR